MHLKTAILAAALSTGLIARAADTCDRARYTENGQERKMDDGMWGVTVTLGGYKLYFADPQAGQVGFVGTIAENGHPVILSLRLKIVDRKISEIEVERRFPVVDEERGMVLSVLHGGDQCFDAVDLHGLYTG